MARNNVDNSGEITDDAECTDNLAETGIPAGDSTVENDTGNETVDPVKAIHEMRANLSTHSPARKLNNGDDQVSVKRTDIDSRRTKKHTVISAYSIYSRADVSHADVGPVKRSGKTSVSI